MSQIVAIALGGALGSLARYVLSSHVQRQAGGMFPWGTSIVNLLGCFLFGLAWTLLESRYPQYPNLRAAVLTGLLGAFTTFSTFAFETAELLRAGHLGQALASVLLQVVLGVLLIFAGITAGELV